MKRLYFLYILSLLAITSSLSQTEHVIVKAEKGDGIYSILRNNGLDPIQFREKFILLNKEKLGSENKLYVGHDYRLPFVNESVQLLIKETDTVISKPAKAKKPATTYAIESLLGVGNDTVLINSNKLKSATYYLVSGHGGPDPGAVAKYNGKIISEDEYAYDVTLRLARKLLSHGAEVHIMIKDPDDGIRDEKTLKIDHDEVSYSDKAIPRGQKARLKQRTEEINKLYRTQKGYRRLIVTHVDSRSVGKNIDVFFYHHKYSKNGKRLATNIQSTFKKKYARYQPKRRYTGTIGIRNLYMVQNTLPAMTYIELGNIRNKKDQKRILDSDNREAMAKWITEGLILDFEQSEL